MENWLNWFSICFNNYEPGVRLSIKHFLRRTPVRLVILLTKSQSSLPVTTSHHKTVIHFQLSYTLP